MKKFLYVLLIFLTALTAFVACTPDPVLQAEPEEVDLTPKFTLYPTTSNTDAIDVFTAGPGLSWAKTTENTPGNVALRIIAKKDDGSFSACDCDRQWARDDDNMMPATYHYFTKNNVQDELDPKGSLLKIQIQCINETQGLCVAKFSSQYIKTTTDLNRYKGTWEIQIGTPDSSNKDKLKDVFYKAYIVIE